MPDPKSVVKLKPLSKKAQKEAAQVVPAGPVFHRMNISDRVNVWFDELTCQGIGDVRGLVTADALLANEDRNEWTIGHRKLDRSAVMVLIVELLFEYPLTEILRMTGMPRPRTLASWLERYPSFAQAFESGERMRGLLKAEEAQEIADTATEKNVKSKKLQVDVRLRLAEAYDPKRFARRATDEDPRDLSKLTDREVEDKFKAFLESNKQALEDRLGVRFLMDEKGNPIGAIERASVIESIPKVKVVNNDFDIPEEDL